MTANGIPSPKYKAFDSPEPAKAFVRELAGAGRQCVIKADGLAAGKGAIVTNDVDEADSAIDACLVEREFGDAGALLVV